MLNYLYKIKGDDILARLKEKRKDIGSTLREDLFDKLNELNHITKVPKTKLLDEAVELLIEKRKNDFIKNE